MDYMAEKESKLHEQKKNLEKILPELQLKRQLSKFKSEAQIFKGNKGWRTAFDDITNTLQKGEKLLITGISNFDPEFKRMIHHWHAARARKGIKAEILLNYDAKESGEKFSKLPHTKVKYMQEGLVTPAVFLIYKNKTLLSLPNQRTFLRIENEEATNSFKSYFKLLWDQKVQTYQGQSAVEKLYDTLINMAKPDDDVIIFAAKPTTKRGADYNRDWNKKIRKKVKNVRLLYYGDNETNRLRAKEIAEQGCETKILPTAQTMPISTVIVGNSVLNAVWGNNPMSFRIDNKTIADSYRENFEILWNQDVTVATGIDKVHDAWDRMLDELNPGDEYCVMSAAWHGQKENIPQWFKDFHTRRINKKVRSKFLFTSGTEKALEQNKKYYYTYSEVKFLPEAVYEGMQVNLYNNKVLFLVWKEKPSVILIDDKQIYDTFKTYFNTLWNQDTYTLTGLDAVQQLFDDMLEAGSCDFISARGYFVDARPKYIDEWEKKATKSGFKMRNIVDKETKGHKITKFPFAETKYILPKEYAPLSVFWIFNNEVAISNWTEKEPSVIRIKSKKMFDMYKKQFETLWNKEIFN